MALDIRYGDGSDITVADMNEVRKAVHDNMVFTTWQRGDLMCIDNFSTSHGRQPTYDFGRKILVAWSHPHDKTSTPLPSPIDLKSEGANMALLKKCCSELYDDAHVPGAVEATPNTSPDSTLSSDEAHDLKELLGLPGNRVSTNVAPHKRHISCPNPSLTSIFS